jgi:putative Mg2+ transporter-C (MgtC) family protein
MLVCLSAMLFVRLGLALIGDAAARFPSAALRADPTRTIEALAVGISFIGAGTIFRDRSGMAMQGLTTAAGLLAAASIGIAVAINRYIVACGITLICLFILRTLSRVEKRSKLHQQRKPD